jgi:hypothetical protein
MIYKVCFKKRIQGKKHAFIGAESHRKTRDAVEFLDKSGKVVGTFSVLIVKDAFPFCDGDDPAALGLS